MVSEDTAALPIFESAPVGMVLYDPETGAITDANDRFLDLVGYDWADLDGMVIGDLTERADPPITARDHPVTWTIKCGSGEYRSLTVEVTAVTVDGADRRLGTVRAADSGRLSRAIERAGSAVYVAGADGRIEYVNDAFERVTGYEQDSVLGRSAADIGLDGEGGEAWSTVVDGDRWQGELDVQHQSGQPLHVDQTLAPVLDETGGLEFAVGVLTDISTYRQRQRHLEVLQRLFRHDLRNNLNAILSSAQPLASENDDEVVQRRGDIITEVTRETFELCDEVEQAAETIEETGPTTRRVDLGTIIESELEQLEAEHPSVAVDTDVGDDLVVLASNLLDRALRNVFQNAVEHSDRDQPHVSVWTERRDGTVAVHVADDGPGIGQIDVITTDDPAQVSSLDEFGLWLVDWIVTHSGGELSFEENDPRGTVVTMTLTEK